MIYATAYNARTKAYQGESVPAGFDRLADIEALMGPPTARLSAGVAVYGEGDQRTLYSRVPFHIDQRPNWYSTRR